MRDAEPLRVTGTSTHLPATRKVPRATPPAGANSSLTGTVSAVGLWAVNPTSWSTP